MKDFAAAVALTAIIVLFFAKYDAAVKDVIFSLLGVAVAAYAIWLTVRITNFRDRRAIRRAIFLVLVIVVYPLSMGPLLWLGNHGYLPRTMEPAINVVFFPTYATLTFGPSSIKRGMSWYLGLWNRL
jgi:hypothetical protein